VYAGEIKEGDSNSKCMFYFPCVSLSTLYFNELKIDIVPLYDEKSLQLDIDAEAAGNEFRFVNDYRNTGI
jgi:hypothetical protein